MTPALALVLLAAGADTPRYLGPRVAGEVRRVVTLAPSLTQAVLALGKGERLVGVSRFDELPEVASLPRVGGFVDPSVEAVVALKPDLVLVQPGPGNQKPVERLASLGVSVLVLPMHSVASTLLAMREVGRALGAVEQADALVARIEEVRAQVRARSAGKKGRRVLFVYGFNPLIVAGPGSYAHELLSDVGATNVAEDAAAPYTTYSVERALRARVDVVIDGSDMGLSSERVRALPGLGGARWVKFPSKDLLHPGPKLARGLEALEALLDEG